MIPVLYFPVCVCLLSCLFVIIDASGIDSNSYSSNNAGMGSLVPNEDANYFNETEYMDRIIATIERGDARTLQDLVYSGIDVNAEGTLEVGPLLIAAYAVDLECIKVLVEADADPDVAEGDGWTPLMFVAHAGSFEATKYLIDQGADPFMANHDEFTAYEIAQANGFSKVGGTFTVKVCSSLCLL